MARSTNLAIIIIVLIILLVLQFGSELAGSYSIVKHLPGFQGPLPFQLETGYIGVGKSEDVQLFYYFVKSQGNAKEDPLLLWLTGGPGCSALSGLLYEIGPFTFEVVEYNGSLPRLIINPYSWTKAANIIFLDTPVGTGFSYARTQLASHSSDLVQVQQVDQFLRKWLKDHPEFLPNPVYISGDSYSGIIVPAIVQHISNGNEEGIEPQINLKGYVIGNPTTDARFDTNSKVAYAYGMGLISYELYESLKGSCGEDYVNIEHNNTECLKYLEDFNECVTGLQPGQILEPICGFASQKPFEIFDKRRRSLYDYKSPHFLEIDPRYPSIGCRTYGYVLSYIWVGDNRVRKALNIRKGSVNQWLRCNYGINYTNDIPSSLEYHVSLGKKGGYRSLVYSGDHDMVVPFLGTRAWTKSLNFSIVDDWRQWHVQGQVAGYTRTYSNHMTYATVKGGGHTAPEYKPEECLAMFKRWASQEPL